MTDNLQPAELVVGDEPIECRLDLAATTLGAGLTRTTLALVLDAAWLPAPHTVAGLAARLLRLGETGRFDVRARVIALRGATCASVGVTFTAFAAGEPTRALVEVAIDAASEADAGAAERGTHQLLPGEDLPGVAYAVYGDATRWRAIAEATGIDDPLGVRTGTVLVLPPPEA